jgi:hypothetical protein
MLLRSLWKMQDFMFCENKPMSFHPLPYSLCTIELTCVISWWCPHIGRHFHCRSHSSWFGFISFFFAWGCDDNYGLGEGWFLLGLVPSRHVSPFSCGSFWVFSLVGGWVFSSMCQHDVRSKGCWKPSFFKFTHLLQAKGVSDVITCACDLYFETCCSSRWVLLG